MTTLWSWAEICAVRNRQCHENECEVVEDWAYTWNTLSSSTDSEPKGILLSDDHQQLSKGSVNFVRWRRGVSKQDGISEHSDALPLPEYMKEQLLTMSVNPHYLGTQTEAVLSGTGERRCRVCNPLFYLTEEWKQNGEQYPRNHPTPRMPLCTHLTHAYLTCCFC